MEQIESQVLQELSQITGKQEIEAVGDLILKYYQARLAYWQMVDKYFSEKKGMDFQQYHDTQYKEWDGPDWQLIEEFHDWEGAIASLQHYEESIKRWEAWNQSSLKNNYSLQ